MQVTLPLNRPLSLAATVVVGAADAYANEHHQLWGDWLAAALFGYIGAYCTQNFLRCREVHCAVTAPGFLAASVLMVLRIAGVVNHGYGVPWTVFLASACIGYCVQWLYERKTGNIFFADRR